MLDEACAAWETDLVDRELLRKAVLEKRAGQELALTGRLEELLNWLSGSSGGYETSEFADRVIPGRVNPAAPGCPPPPKLSPISRALAGGLLRTEPFTMPSSFSFKVTPKSCPEKGGAP